MSHSISATPPPPGRAIESQPPGEACPGCQRSMPVRAKRPDEVTIHWQCTACRSTLTGVLLKEAMPLLAAHVHLGQNHFDASQVPPVPAALRELVREFLARRQQHGQPPHERRKSPRVSHQLDVILVPLDDDWRPLGKPILGIVVDLSAHGLGMITSAPVVAPYAVAQIQLGNGFVQLLGRIVWAKEVGRGFHNTGLQFVARFGRARKAQT